MKKWFLACRVRYVQPSFETLERRFIDVDPSYKGKRFDPIEGTEGASTKSREVTFEWIVVKDRASYGSVLSEMAHRRLRPASYEELLAFHENRLDMELIYEIDEDVSTIIALGSGTRVDGGLCAPSLDYIAESDSAEVDDEASLKLTWVYEERVEGDCLLAVRKSALGRCSPNPVRFAFNSRMLEPDGFCICS